METTHTIFPKDFPQKIQESFALTLSPLEKELSEDLSGNDDVDFRIIINRNNAEYPPVHITAPDKLSRGTKEKLGKRIHEHFVRSKLNREAGFRSIWFRFFDKTDEKIVANIKKLEINAQETSSVPFSDKGLSTFIPVEPRYNFSQIYMPESQRAEIRKTLNILKNHDLIYKTWGFEKIDPAARSILNFYGPPGTGKTMTAHAIAAELGTKILELNYAEIESKYVGDAPKNLVNAFDTAKAGNAVLFFDEADSFLSKRATGDSSPHAQSMNSQRSQMLMLLENFKGVVIFCTNLIKNYDSAFKSRILASIEFKLPDANARKEILKKLIPAEIPFKDGKSLSDEELLSLAEILDGLSGRELKNAVLKTLCAVAEKPTRVFEYSDFESNFNAVKEEIKRVNEAQGVVNTSALSAEVSKNLKTNNFTKHPKTKAKKRRR